MTGSIFFAGVSVVSFPIAALLDRFISDVGFIKLLEGRVLVFPERVFDSSMSLSTYIPVSLIGVPDLMLAFQDMSTCVPSPAMARNDLYCSILANMGPDVFALAILITICVVISATSNRIIDYRIRKQFVKIHPADTVMSPAAAVRVTTLTRIIGKQAPTTIVKTKRPTIQPLEVSKVHRSKPSPRLEEIRGWTCLGRGYIPPDVQLTM